jgi:hypothetical protein
MVEGILQLTEDIHGEADGHNRLLDGMVLISFSVSYFLISVPRLVRL